MAAGDGAKTDVATSIPLRGRLARLTSLMTPPAGGGDVIDWAVLAGQGVILPADYREFVAVHGAGDIDGVFQIVTPRRLDLRIREREAAGDAADRAAYLMSVRLDASLEQWRPWEQEREDDEGRPETVKVVVFGTGLDGEVAFWECCSDDPDAWTVLMFKRQHNFDESGWRRFDCGMVDFLAAVLDGSISGAFSAANFPGSPPVFTSHRDYPYSEE